jgi:hypothetical protein
LRHHVSAARLFDAIEGTELRERACFFLKISVSSCGNFLWEEYAHSHPRHKGVGKHHGGLSSLPQV